MPMGAPTWYKRRPSWKPPTRPRQRRRRALRRPHFAPPPMPELCRQVARFGPARLVLLELSEFNLYRIEQELGESHAQLPLVRLITDVKDLDQLRHHGEQKRLAHQPAEVLHLFRGELAVHVRERVHHGQTLLPVRGSQQVAQHVPRANVVGVTFLRGVGQTLKDPGGKLWREGVE